MSIKKTLQSWESTLEQEAKQGNEDAQVIFDWMKRNGWLKSQKHLPLRPFLQGVKPKIEV